MQLTKFTHACIRLEKDGKVLLVDPGVWTEAEAFEGVDGILITHEHSDHLDVDRLLPLDVPIWTNASVASKLSEVADRVSVVSGGESFNAAGFSVDAFGNDHAIILPELGVPCQNVAFLIEDAVYHPGDSWTLPGRAVHTNLIPLSAPWHTLADAITFGREVKAEQAIGIHDALLSDRGQALTQTWLTNQTPAPYNPLTPGTSTDIP
ncbi:MBL fold metallo-hydrolase [Kribbella deserti]|uniref:MBL fold metallo-hydrolase n=1 Tax=Kribbella deserti TaxID=1926257 RepID=A0ABV6QVE3_9ACTN